MYGIKKQISSDANGVISKTYAVYRILDDHIILTGLTLAQAVAVRNALNSDPESLQYAG